MGLILLKNELQAELFIERLRQASKQPSNKLLSNQLYDICLQTPNALPLIAHKLQGLRFDHDYIAMIGYLSNLGFGFLPEFRGYFFTAICQAMANIPNTVFHVFHIRRAHLTGCEDTFLSALIEAMKHAHAGYDQWYVMKAGIYGLNKFGHHQRALDCSFIAYEIAQQQESEALKQCCGYSIQHSIRLVGNANIRWEYLQEYRSLTKGTLLYLEANQFLVPIYAAMHLMDLSQNDKMIPELLRASDECPLHYFARLNNKLAWARYSYLRGQTHRARNQVYELVEEFSFPMVDAPVMRPLLSLAGKLGIDTTVLGQPLITQASRSQWFKFDMALDLFWTSIKNAGGEE